MAPTDAFDAEPGAPSANPAPAAERCGNCGELAAPRAGSPTGWTHQRDRIDWCNPDHTPDNAHTLAEPA